LAADNRTVPALAEIAPIFPTPETESPLKKELKKVLTLEAEIQYQRGWLQNR
jgi:hypothetical protein